MLKIHNSLTRQKEVFTPITPDIVNMYVCGITVYDYCHIGHARMLVVFDMVVRYLRYSGYQVNYVRNITDIDDKIIARANENNEPIDALTTRFSTAMHQDETALKCLAPTIEPRATEAVDEMIALIEALIAKGHAYVASSKDVLYAVDSFADYGKLANQNLDELQAGQRVEVDAGKRSALDFVLWKSAKPNEPAWDSPWGKGRPGWHIECSAMAKANLGDHFDIHGGGLDLKFPHHECEIAQSEPVCGKHVNYWMHNGFVQVDSEKMSKSLGNFFTIRDVLDKFSGEVIRFFVIGTHYRSPLNYSDSGLQDAENGLARLYTALRNTASFDVDASALRLEYPEFFAAMDDDFNTAKAISVLFSVAKTINKTVDNEQKNYLASALKALGGVLGILQDNPDDFLQAGNKDDAKAIADLILARHAARADKDFARADAIRDQLDAMGVAIEDNAGQTSWRYK